MWMMNVELLMVSWHLSSAYLELPRNVGLELNVLARPLQQQFHILAALRLILLLSWNHNMLIVCPETDIASR